MDECDTGDGQFNFYEVLDLYKLYPQTLYPVFRLQSHVMRHSFGEEWWHRYDKYQQIRNISHIAVLVSNTMVNDSVFFQPKF